MRTRFGSAKLMSTPFVEKLVEPGLFEGNIATVGKTSSATVSLKRTSHVFHARENQLQVNIDR